jgi:enterochelin esterase-like enzyme
MSHKARRTGWPLRLAAAGALALGLIGASMALPAEPPFGGHAPAQAQSATEAARPHGRVEERTVNSPVLGKTMPYLVYLPPGYDEPGPPYPVLYFLHGMSGKRTEWQENGFVDALDELMSTGAVAPFIVVLPQGDQGYWMDQANGPRWATYVARDVVPAVDASFQTVPYRGDRAVGGLSMGAYGALELGIRFPDVFGIVGAHTLTLRDYDRAAEWFGPDIMKQFYGDRAGFNARDPLMLFRTHPDVARTLDLRLDVGAEDEWLDETEAFSRELDAAGVRHEFEALDGAGHAQPDFWQRHAIDFASFYARAFERSGAPT